jgi:hypothetical protein
MWQLGNRMYKMLEDCASSDKVKAFSKNAIKVARLSVCSIFLSS